MTRNVVRLGDLSFGHCYPPRPCITASPNVFSNGIPNHRQFDWWAVHCCGDSCHDGYLLTGSPTYFVNGRQQGRIFDPISCGDTAGLTHSPNVFVGP